MHPTIRPIQQTQTRDANRLTPSQPRRRKSRPTARETPQLDAAVTRSSARTMVREPGLPQVLSSGGRPAAIPIVPIRSLFTAGATRGMPQSPNVILLDGEAGNAKRCSLTERLSRRMMELDRAYGGKGEHPGRIQDYCDDGASPNAQSVPFPPFRGDSHAARSCRTPPPRRRRGRHPR